MERLQLKSVVANTNITIIMNKLDAFKTNKTTTRVDDTRHVGSPHAQKPKALELERWRMS
jgi:hypothetical protein